MTDLHEPTDEQLEVWEHLRRDDGEQPRPIPNRMHLDPGTLQRVQMKPGYFAVLQQICPDTEWLPNVRLWAGQLRHADDTPVVMLLHGMPQFGSDGRRYHSTGSHGSPILYQVGTDQGRAQLLDQLADLAEPL